MTADRSEEIFQADLSKIIHRTDRMFLWLLIGQWIFAILVALVWSPRTWIAEYWSIHQHVYAAVILGALFGAYPVYLILRRPGTAYTRHIIAIGQMLQSALLVHVTGGRIETHFHVFGSLALLSFYRDWPVLITGSVVVFLDHLALGAWFPLSVYGVLTASAWRAVEHAFWVIFEDVFLIMACRSGNRELRGISNRQMKLEENAAELDRTNAQLDASRKDIIFAGEFTDNIMKNMPNTLIVFNLDATIRTVNQTTLKLLGYEEKELVGQPIGKVFAEAAEEEGFAGTKLQELIEKSSVRGLDVVFRAKSGENIPMSLLGSVMRDEAGKLIAVVCVARDMRETRRLIAESAAAAAEKEKRVALEQVNARLDATIQELKLAQTQLIQAEKMTTIGQLAGGIAHEINNPLAGILTTAQLALKETPEGFSQTKDDLNTIVECSLRCKKIVASLLEFSRSQPFEIRILPVGGALQAALTLIQNEASLAHVTIANLISRDTPSIKASAFELQQVFLNLMINAIQAMPRGAP